MAFRARTPFDPSASFVARKTVTIGERAFAPGDPFPTDLVDVRRLRQMWSNFSIDIVGSSTAPAARATGKPMPAAQRKEPPRVQAGKR